MKIWEKNRQPDKQQHDVIHRLFSKYGKYAIKGEYVKVEEKIKENKSKEKTVGDKKEMRGDE